MRCITILVFFSVLVSPLIVWGQGEETYIEIVPSYAAYNAAEEITVVVTVHALEPATSFQVHLPYNIDSLEVEEIQTNTEDFPHWWDQQEENGVVKLAASVPTPGYQGRATVATITFTALRSGFSEFAAGEGALVLNTQNENILLSQEASKQEDPVESTIIFEQDVPKSTDFSTGNDGIIIVVITIVVIAVAAGWGILLWQRKNRQGV